jgi:hypothetical protein
MPTPWHDARLELRNLAQIDAGALAVPLHAYASVALKGRATRVARVT